MFKCANCDSDAIYEYVVVEDFGIKYCQRHLPKFTKFGEAAQKLRTIESEAVATDEAVVETPKIRSNKKEQTVVEPEAVAEGPTGDNGDN
jgi:hypothetical protein